LLTYQMYISLLDKSLTEIITNISKEEYLGFF